MVISIFKFLSRYYGIRLDVNVRCTHVDIRHSFSFLEVCNMVYANSHPELVSKGKILYVRDTIGEINAYFQPSKIVCLNDEINNDKKNYNDIDYNLLDNLNAIPTYILRELLSRYKDSCLFYRMIKKELIKRGIYDCKRYKLIKELEKLRESDCGDKYQRRRQIKCKKS